MLSQWTGFICQSALFYFLIAQEPVDLKQPHALVLKVGELELFGIFSHFFHSQQRVAKQKVDMWVTSADTLARLQTAASLFEGHRNCWLTVRELHTT